MPGYEAANWIGIVAPAGTPAAIVEKLHKEIALMQDTPEAQKQFANEGAEETADEFRRVRQVHRVGNRQMGTRGEGGRHQGAVIHLAAVAQFGAPGSTPLATSSRSQGMV